MEGEFDPREYLSILIKRKWLLTGIVLIAILIGIGASLLIQPVYESPSTIFLGKFNNSLYNTPSSARELLLSDGFVSNVLNEVGTDPKLGVNVDLIKDTSLLKVAVRASNPAKAQKIAKSLAGKFVDQSTRLYDEVIGAYKLEITEAEKQQKLISEDLINNKKLLSRYEAEDPSSFVNWYQGARVSENIRNDKRQILDLQQRVLAIKKEMMMLEKPSEIASSPAYPISPDKKRIIITALILGLIIAPLIVFLFEYISKQGKNKESRQQFGG